MAGKVSGVTHPANLADGATITETWVDNVTNSIIGLDGALAKIEPVYATTTVAEVSNDNTENTLFTYTVPANTLGTGNMLRFQAATYTYNGVGTTYTCTYKLYYGTTGVIFSHEMENSSSNLAETMFGVVQANGATNAQVLYAVANGRYGGSNGDPATGIDLTCAEDSTGALDMKVTATLSSANANLKVGFLWSIIYLVDIS